MPLSQVQLGDLPTWISSIGTAGALGVSVWLLAREIRDRRNRENERRASQASLVAGWTSGYLTTGDPYPEIHVRIRNGSFLPVYQLSMKVAAGVRGTFVRFLNAMGPDETREFRIILPAHPRGEIFAPALTFADAAGRQWLRETSGVLRQVKRYDDADFHEDPAAYDGVDGGHPTLHLPADELWQGGRIIVSAGSVVARCEVCEYVPVKRGSPAGGEALGVEK
jgi:hypothetical protein